MHEILLVEDNPDDVELTMRAFRKSNIVNEIVVARDGVEALDYLFSMGTRAGRPPTLPQVVLLDVQMPRVDRLRVLGRSRRVRGDDVLLLLDRLRREIHRGSEKISLRQPSCIRRAPAFAGCARFGLARREGYLAEARRRRAKADRLGLSDASGHCERSTR